MLRRSARAVALSCGAWCLGAAADAGPAVALRTAPSPEMVWHGMPLRDSSGGTPGVMMYPAPNVLGLLVAIATHGAIAEKALQAERERRDKAADQVLEPYRQHLAEWTLPQLADAALPRLSPMRVRLLQAQDEPAAEEWLIDVAPSFALSQDESTLMLDVATRVVKPGDPAPRFQNVVRVLSTPLPVSAPPGSAPPTMASPVSAAASASAVEGPALPASAPPSPSQTPQWQHWTAKRGKALREETAAMLAHAVELALLQADRADTAELPYRTHRYLAGRTEAIERAQLLASGCNRVVLRTLRGWLLSAATAAPADAPACAAGYGMGG